jgi:hypothetical protein
MQHGFEKNFLNIREEFAFLTTSQGTFEVKALGECSKTVTSVV